MTALTGLGLVLWWLVFRYRTSCAQAIISLTIHRLHYPDHKKWCLAIIDEMEACQNDIGESTLVSIALASIGS